MVIYIKICILNILKSSIFCKNTIFLMEKIYKLISQKNYKKKKKKRIENEDIQTERCESIEFRQKD